MSYSCASSLSARDTQACAPPQARWTPWEQDGSLRGHAPHVHPSCSLTLEWNSLGTWEEAFAAFCGALAANGALRQLDLRNNQIDQVWLHLARGLQFSDSCLTALVIRM